MTDQPLKHSAQHTPHGPDKINYHPLHIALTGDRDGDEPVAVESNVFREIVQEDADTLRLKRLSVGVGVASSSGAVSVAIYNETQGYSLLASDASVPSGDNYAEQSSEIANDPHNVVFEGDVVRIDITEAGTGAKGLKVRLIFW